MNLRYNKKNYTYQAGQVFKGNKLVRNQAQMLKVFSHFVESMKIRGFHLRMDYNEFDSYLMVLGEQEKNDLFHNIYEHYSYANSLLAEKVPQKEFVKIMARLKRYEQYLYKILES